MRSIRKWLAAGAAGLALFAVGVAWAQVTISFNLTGNEIVLTALPGGGASNPVPAYVLRSGENHTFADAGTTVTTQVPATSGQALATGAITTWNVNLPTAPYTGQRVIINCPGGTVTTLTITATLPSGVAITGTNPTSCTSGGAIANGAGFTYSTSRNIWFRYQ